MTRDIGAVLKELAPLRESGTGRREVRIIELAASGVSTSASSLRRATTPDSRRGASA